MPASGQPNMDGVLAGAATGMYRSLFRGGGSRTLEESCRSLGPVCEGERFGIEDTASCFPWCANLLPYLTFR